MGSLGLRFAFDSSKEIKVFAFSPDFMIFGTSPWTGANVISIF